MVTRGCAPEGDDSGLKRRPQGRGEPRWSSGSISQCASAAAPSSSCCSNWARRDHLPERPGHQYRPPLGPFSSTRLHRWLARRRMWAVNPWLQGSDARNRADEKPPDRCASPEWDGGFRSSRHVPLRPPVAQCRCLGPVRLRARTRVLDLARHEARGVLFRAQRGSEPPAAATLFGPAAGYRVDREVLAAQAEQNRRRAEQQIRVSFDEPDAPQERSNEPEVSGESPNVPLFGSRESELKSPGRGSSCASRPGASARGRG